jgi:hypothetical protein
MKGQFTERLPVQMTEAFLRAIIRAATDNGLSASSYARVAMSERLRRDGVKIEHEAAA